MVARALHDAGRDGVGVDEKRGARRAAAFPSPYVGRDRVGGRRTMIKLKGPAAEDLNGFMDEGTVIGRVHGRQRIELLAGSKVQATLISPKLVIEDGAFFQGDCQMGSPPKGAFLPAGGGGS